MTKSILSKSVRDWSDWVLAEACSWSHGLWIDHRLVPILADTLRDFDNVTVVNEDILKVDLAQHIRISKSDLPIRWCQLALLYPRRPILILDWKWHSLLVSLWSWCKKKWQIVALLNQIPRHMVSIAVQYYMTAKVAFIVPRTVFITSTKCELSYPENGTSAQNRQQWKTRNSSLKFPRLVYSSSQDLVVFLTGFTLE